MRVDESTERTVVHARTYRLTIRRGDIYARLEDAEGTHWADLLLLASLDTRDGPDDALSVGAVAVERVGADAARISAPSVGARWAQRRLVLECADDQLRVRAHVRGTGALTDVTLLGGTHTGRDPMPLGGRLGTSRLWSGAAFGGVFSPEPSAPRDPRVRDASASASIDVLGAGLPGMRRWIFTPPPFCFALCMSRPRDLDDIPSGPWLAVGIDGADGAHTFTAFRYEALDDGFAFRLAYEGHTRVDGEHVTPELVLRPGASDPYAALAAYVEGLRAMPRRRPVARSAWWTRPIFCGWGAQIIVARERGGPARDHCRQDNYDAWLAHLERHGVRPGTIVLDDKWQAAYALARPDTQKWPDLRGWIRRRHEAGQRVLLWQKAWDREGLPPELCVRNALGEPVTPDPAAPSCEARIREEVEAMLAPDGLDADGFKIDFTARTPSGSDLAHAGTWGVELLRRLLWIVYDAAKRAKPDALVMTHTPNPYLADVTDMIRLNDVIVERPVVAQMRHRARVARVGCPDALIDTDDWPMRDKAEWRAYLEVQPELGVPSLYFATHVGETGEPLTEDDYAAIRASWERAAA